MMKALKDFLTFVLRCIILLPFFLGYLLVFIMMGLLIFVGVHRKQKYQKLRIETRIEPNQREILYFRKLTDDIILFGTQLLWGALLTVGIVLLVTLCWLDMPWEDAKSWNLLLYPGTIVIWFIGDKLARFLDKIYFTIDNNRIE